LAEVDVPLYLAAWFERRDHLLGNVRGFVHSNYPERRGGFSYEPDLGTTLIIILMSRTLVRWITQIFGRTRHYWWCAAILAVKLSRTALNA
jgi:hypothetical protein